MAETLAKIPSGYDASLSSYSSISSSYPITNAYTNSSSTSYAYITMTTGSRASTYVSLTFDLSSIPDNAIITGVACKAKSRVSSTSYVSTAENQLYTGSTPMGSASSARTTSATVYTLTTGTWTVAQLRNLRLRFTATRGTSSTTRAAYLYVYGADLTITYEVNETKYHLSVSATNGTVISPNGGQIELNDGTTYECVAVGDPGTTFTSLTVNGASANPTEITEPAEDAIGLFHFDSDGDISDSFGNCESSVVGSLSVEERGKFGGALTLDGNSYLKVELPQNYSPVTVECWFLTDQNNTSGQYPTLFSTSTVNAAGGTYLHIDDGSYSQYPVCRSNAASGSSNNGGYGTTIISRNVWHHFAYCRNGSSHYFFLDGQLQYTVSQSNPNSAQTIYIGGRCYNNNGGVDCFMRGMVDELLIANRCKWTTSFTPPAIPYSSVAVTRYSYTATANQEITVIYVFSKSSALYVKENGQYVSYSSVYKKVNGVWVQQTDLSDLFNTATKYVRIL